MFSATLILILYFLNRTFAYNSTYALSPELQQQVLDEHNRLRALHVDTPPLVWNDEVAGFAQDWAAQYDCSGILTHSEKPYGENLAIGYTAIDAIDTWYNEIRFYNYSDPGYSEIVGHFTQMVWKDSSRLGCAIRDCHNEWTTYFVCEYDPPGNYIGYFGQEVMPLKSSLIVPSSSSSLITSTSTTSSSTTSSLATISNLINSSSKTTMDTVTRSSLSSAKSTESLALGLVDSEKATSYVSPISVSVSSSYSSLGRPQPTSISVEISSTSVSKSSTSSSSISSTSTTSSTGSSSSSSTSTTSSTSLSSSISSTTTIVSPTSSQSFTSANSVSSSTVSSTTSQSVFSSSSHVNIATSVNGNSADQSSPGSTKTDISNLDAFARVQSSTSTSTSSVSSSTSTSKSSYTPETSTTTDVSSSVVTKSVFSLPQPRADVVSSSSHSVSSTTTTSQIQSSTSSNKLGNVSQSSSEYTTISTSSSIESLPTPNATTCSNSTILGSSTTSATTTADHDTSVDPEDMSATIIVTSSFASTTSSYVVKPSSVDPEDMSFTANRTTSIISNSTSNVAKISSVVTVLSSADNVTVTSVSITVQPTETLRLRNVNSSSSNSEVLHQTLSAPINEVSSQVTILNPIVNSTTITQANYTTNTNATTTTTSINTVSTIDNQNAIDAFARSLDGSATIAYNTTDGTKVQTTYTTTISSHLVSTITSCNLNGFAVDCTSFTVSVTEQEIIPTTTQVTSNLSQTIDARVGEQGEATLISTTANRIRTFTTVTDDSTIVFTSTIGEVTHISSNIEYPSGGNSIIATTGTVAKTSNISQVGHDSVTNVNTVSTVQTAKSSSTVSILEATNNGNQGIDAIDESARGSTISSTIIRETQAQATKPSHSGSVSTGITNISGNSPHSTNTISHYEGGASNLLGFSSLLYSAVIFILMF